MPPTYVVGNLWDELDRAEVLLVTTNAMVNTRGCLVMGRGAAQEAADRYPDIPQRLGTLLRERNMIGKLYGVIGLKYVTYTTSIGIFQVKYHWRDAAQPTIIAFSAGQLTKIAGLYTRIAMNCPGIGNGRLAFSTIQPLLEPLPSHVYIYTKEPL